MLRAKYHETIPCTRRLKFPKEEASSRVHSGPASTSYLSLLSSSKLKPHLSSHYSSMDPFIRHVSPGLGFLIIGLWQLYNHIKLHCQTPKSYNTSIWFPFPRIRHLELHLLMAGSSISILMELFIAPSDHRPLDPEDWTIPTNLLSNFENATVSFSIFTYSAFALLFDSRRVKAGHLLSTLICSMGFALKFLLFYVRLVDQTRVEGQYQFLLQMPVAVSLITTVMGLGFPRSFGVGFVRSVSVFFQGVWFTLMGFMLYCPSFIPKGCSLAVDEGVYFVPCRGHVALQRAKALANLEFAWSLVAVMVFSVWFYLHLAEKYPEMEEYGCMSRRRDEEDELCESPKTVVSSDSFLEVGDWLKPKDLER